MQAVRGRPRGPGSSGWAGRTPRRPVALGPRGPPAGARRSPPPGALLPGVAAGGAAGATLLQVGALPFVASVAAGATLVSAAWWLLTGAERRPRGRVVAAEDSRLLELFLQRSPALWRFTAGASAALGPLARLLWNGHVETILAAKLRRHPEGVALRRECLRVSNGGTVSLDWLRPAGPRAVALPGPAADVPADAAVLILLPGLGGGSQDHYVQHMAAQARAAGLRPVVFNSRGTGGGPVTSPQFYSAGFTDDLQAVVDHVRRRYPDARLFGVGWSLGANILLNYVAERGAHSGLAGVASMCNPVSAGGGSAGGPGGLTGSRLLPLQFDLTVSNVEIGKGFNRIYDANMANSLKTIFRRHATLFADIGGEFKPNVAANARSIAEFDDAITRVSFGFDSVGAYYRASSSADRVDRIGIPTLCVQAENDPIAPLQAVPLEKLRANANIVTLLTAGGGHLGWADSWESLVGAPWVDGIVLDWLTMCERGHDQPQDQQQQSGGRGGGRRTARTAAANGPRYAAAAAAR